MNIKEELVRQLILDGKWNDLFSSYLEEFQKILLIKSSIYKSIEEFPEMTDKQMRSLRKFRETFQKKFQVLHRPCTVDEFLEKYSDWMSSSTLDDYVQYIL